MDLFCSIQYPVRANAIKLTITTTTTRVSSSSTSMDSSSHAKSHIATAPERPSRYYFRNLEEDMELVTSGIAGYQKEGVPPKTHSAYLEDAIDTLGMSSSLADDDDSCSDDGSSRMMIGHGGEHHSHDWRSRMQISPPLSASSPSSFGSSIEQSSEVGEGHPRGIKVLDRAQFLAS
ncbi:hypothetical protein BGZ81_006929 [Podila clonocystis]|nr:hypothetical protein BGZ81_006929 [Podila clonocystis]